MSSKLYIKFTPPEQIILPYEPETTAYMNNADVNIPNDGTVYFASTAYEITGAELWTALDTFVVAVKTSLGLTLKQNNLSTKFAFLYPRIGGTATAHRINLVDPTTFIGTFSGGWTHDGSGALPNGTNGYMNTNCKYDTPNFDRDDQCFFFDSKTNTNGLYVDIGCQGTGNADINMFTRLGGNLNTRICDGTNSPTAVADSLGLFALSRYSGTEYKQYKEGSVVATKTVSSLIYSATKYDIYEAAANNTGSNIQHSPRKRTLHGSGKSMTDTEMGNFVTAWRTLETTLNR